MTLTVKTDLVQRSDEWYAYRRGLVTASAVGQLISTRRLSAIDYRCPACSAAANEPCRSKVSSAAIKTLHPERAEYARDQDASTVIEAASNPESRALTLLLAAERITGWTDATFLSDDMWRGIDDEPRARDKYSEHYAPVVEAGLMVEDRWGFKIGYSPDGLVGHDGQIEIKSRRPKAHLATILADEVPADNMAQLQCGLMVSGREWVDYVSYCGGMPLWVKRVLPLPMWFAALTDAVTAFELAVSEIIRTYDRSIAGLYPTERPPNEMVI